MEGIPKPPQEESLEKRHERIEREIKIHNFLTERRTEDKGAFEKLEEGDAVRLAGIPDELIIEEINQRNFSERLGAAIEASVLTQVDGLSWSYFDNRPIVFTKVGGQTIPLYRSATGASGKSKGEWYPFFGIGGGFWFIKSKDDAVEGNSRNPIIGIVQRVLNETFNWDKSLDISRNNGLEKHPFSSGTTGDQYMSYKELNERVFQKDLSDITLSGEAEKAHEHIYSVLAQIKKNVSLDTFKEIIEENKKKVTEMNLI